MSSRGPQLLGYPRKTLRSAVMANKLICGSFLVVLFLSCLAEAKSIVPSDQQRSNYQKPQSPGGGGQSKGTFDQEFRSCEVEPQHRIGCGAPGISQQECQELDCCYSNNACYFGTVGEYKNKASVCVWWEISQTFFFFFYHPQRHFTALKTVKSFWLWPEMQQFPALTWTPFRCWAVQLALADRKSTRLFSSTSLLLISVAQKWL